MLKIIREKIKRSTKENIIVIPVPPQKVNIKIHKADLSFIDQLAKKLDTSRSLILNEIIRKILIKKLKSEVEEFDSQFLLASIADKLSPENIVDGCNDLEESWIFEVAREEFKENMIYKYENYLLSEQEQQTDMLSKSEIILMKHSDEHNDCMSLVLDKLRNEND
ncbi:hypothetical protein CYR32_21060 [Chimaeribacter coloradensis]|uniref:Uncharacterized protein n=1 Tax=Chimaeribacter coloradensis TaxID=2060068 RepID=A0A2N5DST6_9GAMM|nr:hypothetical protein [Chimaeribacter coloradensis]PLR29243.1 hypothetical protein CYR32_21060 [Chimaeribacter coloradensis]